MMEGFKLVQLGEAEGGLDLAAEVRQGLTASPKWLPCMLLYDDRGSRLFEEICKLPEYYLTRAEWRILRDRAREIVGSCASPLTLVELGSGDGRKAGILIEMILGRQETLRFFPVDISRSALEEGSLNLIAGHPGLQIEAIAGEYRDGLRFLDDAGVGAKLILWLGSNIGNLGRDQAVAFLREVRERMGAADRLLVGIDLRKDREILERAYGDVQGVTAAFNKNLLVRINRELGGRFNLDAFEHRARYDEDEGRVESSLVSNRAQTVSIDALSLEVPFAQGEAIHTEESCKYSIPEIEHLTRGAGLELLHQWLDDDRLFSANLFCAAK